MLPFLAFALCALATARAQLAASLKLDKSQYLAGEPVIATVTITNHAGRELTFQSDGRFQWLDFIVKTTNNNAVSPRGKKLFGPMKIKAGESLAREVDLTQHFQLSKPGNFSVAAVVHPPGAAIEGTSTNRLLFSQTPGRVVWSQKVGVTVGGSQTRDMRLIQFSGSQKTHLYAQVADGSSGTLVRTFLLGDMLTLRRPLATIDRNQRMHVLFLHTPSLWVHCVVSTDGKLVARQIHQRGAVGDPKMITMATGEVRVVNSIPYDPKAAAEQQKQIRKATDRPSVSY
ncbi:MAG: hypothetical protein H7A49_02505 [Akkermansiaceae bacterium]|nr:hypothetical protein [Akkermansiaceae bacterium]MCP5542759.1 hypothetical protein [Akkermansiaceae bacterium]MCP5548823.1 hypothetical protein [Akkermansiaceae bacterium]